MNGALWLLPLFAAGYALWASLRLRRIERNEPADGVVTEDTPCRQEIIGRSRSVLDPRHSQPQAVAESRTKKVTEKADIFVPTNVPEHLRQIPPEDLDEMFGVAPEGKPNEPLEADFPSYDESSPNADTEEPDYDKDEDDAKELPLLGRSLAQEAGSEQMGEAYRHVAYGPSSTDEQREETGRVLLDPKQTGMFEVIVSGCPDGNDRVESLIDTYLSAFHRRMSERSAESPSPRGSVPTSFDVREFVQPHNDITMKEKDHGWHVRLSSSH